VSPCGAAIVAGTAARDQLLFEDTYVQALNTLRKHPRTIQRRLNAFASRR